MRPPACRKRWRGERREAVFAAGSLPSLKDWRQSAQPAAPSGAMVTPPLRPSASAKTKRPSHTQVLPGAAGKGARSSLAGFAIDVKCSLRRYYETSAKGCLAFALR